MRLSATDRIIRDAEQCVAEDDDTIRRVVKAESELATELRLSDAPPTPWRADAPQEGLDAADGSGRWFDDDERQTQVDSARLASALQTLRSLENAATPPPSIVAAAPNPAGARVLPPGIPASWSSWSATPPLTESSPGPTTFPPEPAPLVTIRRRHGSRLTSGVLVAAGIAATVVFAAGTWSAHHKGGDLAPTPQAAMPQPPPPRPSAAPIAPALPVPPPGDSSPAPAVTPEGAMQADVKPSQLSATDGKLRRLRKPPPGDAIKRAPAAAAVRSRSRPARVVHGTSGRHAPPAQPSADPDAILPITLIAN